jgi:hypothetical protein
MVKRSQLGGLVAAGTLSFACASSAAIPEAGPRVELSNQSALIRFDRGRQVVSFSHRKQAGIILLYRISAPRGSNIRAFARMPGITVPLRIATTPIEPSSSCTKRGVRVTCTVGIEGCPMPEGTWQFRVEKLAGPAGEVTLSFRIGDPLRQN